MKKNDGIGKSRLLAAKLIYSTLMILDSKGGELTSSELYDLISENNKFNDWESEIIPNGNVRWKMVLSFYSINCVKAGVIIKNKGIWYITDDGRNLIKDKGDLDILFFVEKKFKEWKNAQKSSIATKDLDESMNNESSFDDIKNKSYNDIMNYVHSRTPYEFQDMVAALLRAMGCYTPFIAPKGKDGGIDVIAYSDPLGAKPPILKVQVKHYSVNNPVPIDVIHNIIGVSKGDIPIVVTSGRFTDAAKTEARVSNVRLIDGSEFYDLWIQYYYKMAEEDKSLMPIEPVYFIKRID